MSYSNNMRRTLAKLDSLPSFVRHRLRNFAIRKTIPLVGTAGLSMDRVTEREVRISLRNAKKVQNHIGSVHAAASALLAETATGLLIGMNVQDGSVPLIKTMKLNYVRRSEGDFLAVAKITEADVHRLQTTERGDLVVPVKVVDGTGEEPVICEMTWAWIPKPAK